MPSQGNISEFLSQPRGSIPIRPNPTDLQTCPNAEFRQLCRRALETDLITLKSCICLHRSGTPK
jgi:hypothetical protein